MRTALIQNGQVINVVEAPEGWQPPPGLLAVASATASIGDGWDGEVFIPTPAPEAPPESADTRITRLAFRNRFTQAEKVALELAALDNPAASAAARQQSAALRSYLKDLDAATFVDLTRPDTVAGVQTLEAGALIAAGRASAILTDPIQPHERPLA